MLTLLIVIPIIAIICLEAYLFMTQISAVLEVSTDHDYGFHIIAMQMVLPTKSNMVRNTSSVIKDVFVDIRSRKVYRVEVTKLLNNAYKDNGYKESYVSIRADLFNNETRKNSLFERLKQKTNLDHSFDGMPAGKYKTNSFLMAFDPQNSEMNSALSVALNSYNYTFYTVTCIDQSSQLKWQRRISGRWERDICKCFVMNEQVFIIAMKVNMDITFRNYKIYCLDINTGKTLWTRAI